MVLFERMFFLSKYTIYVHSVKATQSELNDERTHDATNERTIIIIDQLFII